MENNIRCERKRRGWSQEALGERIGVSRQTINAFESGKTTPSLKNAMRLSRAFKAKIEDLFKA